ncbi:hypothetical protein BDP27DRAFT_1250131 [Rhodocollybia butyracea]|uniref:Integrase zinc-binding domain-containing protein n=1 Tax=Rhodocollybia butyracea TaxID=206335 RepID=A0A9P5TVJ7_9AGAR|nr:hypothetical protein BDP27DRAFT_1250131 [Rhodocollybia butyracea]
MDSDDDGWLDGIVLWVQQLHSKDPQILSYDSRTLPSSFPSRQVQEITLGCIKQFLTTLEAPHFASVQAKKRFLRLTRHYLLQGGRLFRKNDQGLPLLTVTDPDQRLRFLIHAHDQLGHRGVQCYIHAFPSLFRDVPTHSETLRDSLTFSHGLSWLR